MDTKVSIVDEIVADILRHEPELPTILRNLSNGDFWQKRELIIEFPMWVRNKYKLWEADLGGEHPDDFSAKIVEKIKQIPPSS